MPPRQKLLTLVGIAKQTGKGAATTGTDFTMGVLSGAAFDLDLGQEPEPITSDGRIAPAANRVSAASGMKFRTRVWPAPSGLFLYGALGAIATTGTSPNFTHTITPAADLPYLTGFGKLDDVSTKLADMKVDELKISWEKAQPLQLEATLLGLVPTLFTASWPAVADQRDQTFFGPIGGTFKLDTGSATPVVVPLSAAEITIANNLVPVELSKSIIPDDVFPGLQVVTFALTLIPNDLAEWRKAVTGSGTGTAIQESVVYGSVDLLVTINANTSLQIAATRVPFIAPFPEGDAGGGPAELKLTGQVVRPVGAGAAVTATLKNAVASY